jgi:hypothetical protein
MPHAVNDLSYPASRSATPGPGRASGRIARPENAASRATPIVVALKTIPPSSTLPRVSRSTLP